MSDWNVTADLTTELNDATPEQVAELAESIYQLDGSDPLTFELYDWLRYIAEIKREDA